MSLNSPAEVIPFSRFLEYRDRLHRIATAKGKGVMPSAIDLGIQLEVTGSATADHAESPPFIGNRLVDA
jgi:hypothetical protein